MYKLIKLQNTFIIINDDKINEGDRIWYKKSLSKGFAGEDNLSNEYYAKIISENIDFSLLSEEDCKIIGGINEDRIIVSAQRHALDKCQDNMSALTKVKVAWEEGFRTAQSLNDKMFSLEQVKQAIRMARDINDGKDAFTAEDISGCTEVCTYGWKNRYFDSDIIQSLQQTEWVVEIEMEQYTQDLHKDIWYNRPKITNNSIKLIKILK